MPAHTREALLTRRRVDIKSPLDVHEAYCGSATKLACASLRASARRSDFARSENDFFTFDQFNVDAEIASSIAAAYYILYDALSRKICASAGGAHRAASDARSTLTIMLDCAGASRACRCAAVAHARQHRQPPRIRSSCVENIFMLYFLFE